MSINPKNASRFYKKVIPLLMSQLEVKKEATLYCCLGGLRCLLDKKERLENTEKEFPNLYEKIIDCMFFPSKKVLKTCFEFVSMVINYKNSIRKFINEGLFIPLLWNFHNSFNSQKKDEKSENLCIEILKILKEENFQIVHAFLELEIDNSLKSRSEIFSSFLSQFTLLGFDEILLLKCYINSFKETNSYLPNFNVIQYYYFHSSPQSWKKNARLYPHSLKNKVLTLLLLQKRRTHFFLRVKPLVLEVIKHIYQNVELKDFQIYNFFLFQE